MRKRCSRLGDLVAILIVMGSVRAAAAEPAAAGMRLYALCVTCHQPNAWGSPDGIIPNLAGQQKRYLERQFAAFRSGARMDAAMQVVAAHPRFGDRDSMARLAGYLSSLQPDPEPVEGPGTHLRVGQETYTHICAACHGSNGGGESSNRVPRIAGQHYPYLRRQIEIAANLHRDLAPPEMTSALRGLNDSEKDSLADYISRLGHTDALLDSERAEEAR